VATLRAGRGPNRPRLLHERDPDSPALDRYAAVSRLLTWRDDATVDDAVTWLRETSRPSTPPSAVAAPAHVRSPRGRAVEQQQGNPVALSGEG
jgi:hypothetical protein